MIGLLTLCPILCGAKEFGHGAHSHGTADGASPGSAPDQCPEDGDNCICQGAVQVDVAAIDVEELPRHPEMDHEHVVVVEPAEEVLAAPVDRREPPPDEPVDERLGVGMTADRALTVDMDVLDAFPDDLTLEVATHDLDLRQLRHPAP